jgi:peptide/nickel transport system substrate-binding protein
VETGKIIAEEARGIGIQADFQPVEFGELVDMIVESKDFEAMIIGTVPMDDPLTDFEIYHSSGVQHLIEPGQEKPRRSWEKRMDELVEQAPSSLTFEQRRSIYEEAQRIWLNELPWIFTITELEYQVHRGEFGNMKPHLLRDYRLPLHRIYRKRK